MVERRALSPTCFISLHDVVLFGIFGSVPGLPASNTTGLAQPFDLGLVQHLAQLAAVAVCPAAAVRSWSCAECIAPTSHGAVSNVTVRQLGLNLNSFIHLHVS